MPRLSTASTTRRSRTSRRALSLGRDLVVEAYGESDRVIEAIRLRGRKYVLGVQWHPEFHRRGEGTLDDSPLLADFLAAARAARNP